MANLTKTAWPLGWQPSSDPVNGDPRGLQRMDNLQQDEEGAIALVRGLRQINTTPLANYPDSIYSRNINGTEAIWTGLGATGTDIVRSLKGDFSDSVSLGAGTQKVCFGSAFGQVLAIGGQTRKKDDGTNITNLGLLTPQTPTLVVNNQPIISFSGTWTVILGSETTATPTGFLGINDASALQLIALLGTSANAYNPGGNVAADPSKDIFSFGFIADDPSAVQGIEVKFVLDDKNFYKVTFVNNPVTTPTTNTVGSPRGAKSGQVLLSLAQGPDQKTVLTCLRSDFVRNGTDHTKSWSAITGIQFSVIATSVQSMEFDTPQFIGGAQGTLNGTYTYVQVNVNDNGVYVAVSPPSPATDPVALINGSVTLTPSASEKQVTECRFYRTTVAGSQVGNQNSFLDQYYLVASCKPTETATDTLSDVDAIDEDQILNPFLVSMNAADPNGIKDDIFAMEGLYYERMLYMAFGFLYLSDRLNPDAIDSRYTIRVSGDATEFNVSLKQLTNNSLILYTSKNSYEISGTLEDLPDGTLDIIVTPIGEQYPPLSVAGGLIASAGGSHYYVAADGVRATTGSNSQLISPQLRLLFQGESRAGLPPVTISPYARYAIGIGKTKLLVTIPFTDGTDRLVIYDLVKQVWRVQETDPISIFVTQSDRVLLGFNVNGVGDIFELDTGTGVMDSGGNFIEGLPIYFQTGFDDNGQPRNRKDTFTLKIVAETGGRACTVSIAYTTASSQDEENAPSFQTLGVIQSSGKETFYFDMSGFTLGFKYALRIVDTALLTSFHLYEYTIEYDPRPEQLNYLRIQPDNLGTICRKRIVSYAFIIDTLGNNVNFQPYVDGAPVGSVLVVNTIRKTTVIYYFQAETIGTDFFGIFSEPGGSGIFEFYGPALSEIVSEKLPVPAEFLLIPQENYGTPHRKRHSSYKFQILTRGKNVQFTPRIDGTNYTPATYNTIEKRTVEYFFKSDTIGIDIGGTLQSIDSPVTPFEYYGTITPEDVETLPARLEYFRIPNNNFGTASRKRIRTIPLIIDTYGQDVIFTPIVDGIQYASTILNSTGKTTLWHYFNFDTFGVDYGGQLTSSGNQPFEFYGMGELVNVETLPVGRVYDQLGPMRFDKIGKIFGFRIRLISTGDSSLNYAFVGDDNPTIPDYVSEDFTGTFPVTPNIDFVYDIKTPKNINLTMCRLVIGPSQQPFHRYDCQIRVSSSGTETDAQWIPIR